MSAPGSIAGLREGLHSLHYPLITEHLPLLQTSVLPQADLVAFGSKIPSQKWACIAGQSCPDQAESERYVRAMSQTGIKHACLSFPTGRGELWTLDAGQGPGELDLQRIVSARIDMVVRHLVENADKFGPEQVISEKFRSRPDCSVNNQPWQMSFASAGLVEMQEEQSESSLKTLLTRCTDFALTKWKDLEANPQDADIRIARTFLRLVAARALVDKHICSADQSDMAACLASARELLPSFMDPDSVQVPPEILEALWLRLQEVRFELLTGDMLAGIYEEGLLSASQKRKLGIHYTPHSLRRFLWNAISEHLDGVDLRSLRIMDPTCGSGAFLLTAYDGLVRMLGESTYKPHSVSLVRNCLIGVDQDPFACDIARLALILQSQPTSNAWGIEQSDFLKWMPRPGNEPNVVIGNPPFTLGTDVLLRSIACLSPGGLIAMVMPKSFLTSVKHEFVRDRIVEDAQLIGVVEFPDRIFRKSQASTCAIVARRRSDHRSSAREFDYLALDRSILPYEQKRRFLLGDWGFSKTGVRLGEKRFADGSLELADLWDSVQVPMVNKDIADFRQGIILRAKKPDKSHEETEILPEAVEVADVSDSYKPGYLPFLENARDCIEPFFIKGGKYLEWAPEKMYTPSKLERWQPNKVVIGRQVTHKRRWRLKGAVDLVGFAYDSRVIGCIPTHENWSSYALLSFLTSSYANAWYSSHSQQGDITLELLRRMPVPGLSEGQLEHLSALGEAVSRCAEVIATKDLDDVSIAVCEYALGLLLQEVDDQVFKAWEFNAAQQDQIRMFLEQADNQRPGLPEHQLSGTPLVIHQQREDESVPLYDTTGIVLACANDTMQAILWLDGLDLAVPLIVPMDLLPNDLRRPGEPFKALATLTAHHSSQLAVASISPHPTAHLPRSEMIVKMEELVSRTHGADRRYGDGNDA